MATATFTIKLDETKFKVESMLELTNIEVELFITSVFIGKHDVFQFLSKKTVKALHKEIKNRIC